MPQRDGENFADITTSRTSYAELNSSTESMSINSGKKPPNLHRPEQCKPKSSPERISLNTTFDSNPRASQPRACQPSVRRRSRDAVLQCDVDLTGLADELPESMVVNAWGSNGRDRRTIVPDRDRMDESAHMNLFRCRELGQKISGCRDRQHGPNPESTSVHLSAALSHRQPLPAKCHTFSPPYTVSQRRFVLWNRYVRILTFGKAVDLTDLSVSTPLEVPFSFFRLAKLHVLDA